MGLTFATAVVLSHATSAAGPVVVNSGDALDAREVAKILKQGAFVTRSIRDDDAPASVALRIPFAFGSAKVPPSALPQLEVMSQALKQAGTKVVIEGHTDSVGHPDYNLGLSEQRAKAVRDVLVASYGIDRNDLRVVGVGMGRPLPSVEPASRMLRSCSTSKTPARPSARPNHCIRVTASPMKRLAIVDVRMG
jgi:outer membrane protein OmpA-like peptidoglycan-associated protein